MRTAATYKTEDLYFGRTLDYEFSYGETVTVTPRNFRLEFRHMGVTERHFAFIGMAHVADNYPLYYDAVNEKGLCIAGLNFVGNAHYRECREGKDNLAQWELIPWIMARCASVSEAKALLARINLTAEPFAPNLPTAQLHWIISDISGSITLESVSDGIFVYDNPVGGLTNNPPFPIQLLNLNNYMGLSVDNPENRFSEQLELNAYSRGMGAIGLPEPGAGPAAQGQQTIAKEEDDCWVLNGSKIFITNAGFADVFIVIAVTDHVLDKKGRPTKLCSAFIVERTDPGFSVGKAEDKMGIRGSSTCELIFEDCRIPKDRMLGVRGKGFQLAMATLDGGRIGIASQALGIAEGALEETVAYVKERKQFGRSISAFQNTQFELAEMKARVEAAKYLVYAAALKKQEAMDGKKVRYSVEAAQAKLIAARTASDVTRRCLQLFGGYGYTRDYPIERMMRDAKITEIYEGTSEVQMMVISGALLK